MSGSCTVELSHVASVDTEIESILMAPPSPNHDNFDYYNMMADRLRHPQVRLPSKAPQIIIR